MQHVTATVYMNDLESFCVVYDITETNPDAWRDREGDTDYNFYTRQIVTNHDTFESAEDEAHASGSDKVLIKIEDCEWLEYQRIRETI